MTQDSTIDVAPPAERVEPPIIGHHKLGEALAKADKARLVAALRAFFTVEAWTHDEDVLRNALEDIAHNTPNGHTVVYEALTNGA